MSQQNYQQPFPFNPSSSAGTVTNVNYLNFNLEQDDSDVTKSSDSRRDGTKFNVERLYQLTLIPRPGEPVVIRRSGRKNKNEILGLTLARLIKEKHLSGANYSQHVKLAQGIQMRVKTSDFVMVLRLDGRIIAMSDEVENHLGKSMRSLYTQCINIFECLNDTDGDKLRSIFTASADLIQQEHRLVCTFRLPKGKRPSRAREDIKAITMSGHFYSCHDPSSSSPQEKLFIARCSALVSGTTNKSSSSQTSTTARHTTDPDDPLSTVKITLNEDMSISFASSNVKDILGYTGSEMMGNWFGRYLPSTDLEKFETIRQRCFQEQTPTSVCDLFDIYASNGDDRLTFLCQIRPIRERRSKTIKFHVLAQLIDPSLRDEYVKHIESDSESNPISIKAEQVKHVSSSISKTSEDTIVANSPSLSMGLLISDYGNNNDFNHYEQSSPFQRSLSNVVAPLNVHDESWEQLFDLDYNQYPTTTDFSYWATKSFNDSFIECQSGHDLEDILSDYFDEYMIGGGAC